ncbi:MAG: iron chelate uptake ABC transporter family permease subunit, partial [Anaerolineales bacterium]|nr:iron chelate uptake ABC transporter family permease subunit [Anaerolineales bacterium]
MLTLLGLLVGTAGNNYKEIFSGLLNFDDSIAHTIVWDIRLPRVAVSMLAGGCLGLAGVLVQLSTRSELGDPNLFGIGGGCNI